MSTSIQNQQVELHNIEFRVMNFKDEKIEGQPDLSSNIIKLTSADFIFQSINTEMAFQWEASSSLSLKGFLR